MEDPRTVVNLFERHKIHIDPNRPPMTKSECVALSQAIGSLKRSAKTICYAQSTIGKFEDRSDKPSASGMFVNAGLKDLAQVRYFMDQALEVLGDALRHAKEGK
ncbi:MAG: hypothetical protein II863_17910 [Kiritimatiellae bacterium]|nr:hypothetical protein [Kiritimatiellia bacterium]